MTGGSWLSIGVLLAAGIPSSVGAIFSYRAALTSRDNRKQLETSNGKTIGEMVEETHGKLSDQMTEYDTH